MPPAVRGAISLIVACELMSSGLEAVIWAVTPQQYRTSEFSNLIIVKHGKA